MEERLNWNLGLCSPALGMEVGKNETQQACCVLCDILQELEILSPELSPVTGIRAARRAESWSPA